MGRTSASRRAARRRRFSRRTRRRGRRAPSRPSLSRIEERALVLAPACPLPAAASHQLPGPLRPGRPAAPVDPGAAHGDRVPPAGRASLLAPVTHVLPFSRAGGVRPPGRRPGGPWASSSVWGLTHVAVSGGVERRFQARRPVLARLGAWTLPPSPSRTTRWWRSRPISGESSARPASGACGPRPGPSIQQRSRATDHRHYGAAARPETEGDLLSGLDVEASTAGADLVEALLELISQLVALIANPAVEIVTWRRGSGLEVQLDRVDDSGEDP